MDMMATMYANVDYDGKDVQKLTDYVNKEVIPELSRQEGVASVSVGGAVEQSVEVRLNQDKIDEVNKDILTHTNKKLSDAQDKIDKGLRKLQDGEDELSKQQDSLENKQDETYDQLAKGQVKLAQAQATKTAYEATLNGLKASRSALQAEKKAYEDAKLPQTYEQLDAMFANFQATMGDAAKASGIEIPSDVEDAVKNPDKFKKFKAWLTGLGYGDQIKDLSAKSLKQVYQAVKVRMPQIETELGNLKTEIMAAKMIIQTMNKQMAGMDDQQAQVIATEAASTHPRIFFILLFSPYGFWGLRFPNGCFSFLSPRSPPRKNRQEGSPPPPRICSLSSFRLPPTRPCCPPPYKRSRCSPRCPSLRKRHPTTRGR